MPSDLSLGALGDASGQNSNTTSQSSLNSAAGGGSNIAMSEFTFGAVNDLINVNGEQTAGEVVDVRLDFNGESSRFNNLKSLNKNYPRFVASQNAFTTSQNGANGTVKIKDSARSTVAIEMEYNDPYNSATDEGVIKDIRFTPDVPNQAPNITSFSGTNIVSRTIFWSGNATDPDGNDSNLEWRIDYDIDDGSGYDTAFNASGGTFVSSNSYLQFDTRYTARVQVRDEDGATTTATAGARTGSSGGPGLPGPGPILQEESNNQ